MKIWVAGNWYTLPDHVLVVQLSDQDKRNIANMKSECDLYCKYDEEVMSTKAVIKLLAKLKKESP